ncbi:MAG: thymidine phosphorylase [Chloroherpetonaceae bacterium]|nr:thymidine phosphorylase [Chloroherpetonaceae bacterium]MDW8436881.1 thymidine phosphorylase [Chloroherpetonaceae bacterium]
MNPVELIRKKRDGGELADDEIRFFFSSCQAGKIPDYQVAAMLMAIFFRSLTRREMNALCQTMIESGKTANLSAIRAPKVDKHSTGGVGDKTSLILAPIVASLGVAVPMISGRALGHTGGTLDKLESIPNFNVNLSEKRFLKVLQTHRCALIGQTAELAPLDKLLYALRDVTATVESIPLIAASIMSKKIASGLDALVLDVKTGVGAFIPERERSRELAKTLAQIGERYGKRVKAFITAMDEPLGYAVGNWLEVKEAMECLQGRNDALVADTLEVSLALSGAMLLLAKKVKTLQDGVALSKRQIENGQAFQKFLDVAKAQGANIEPLKNFSKYPKSKFSEPIVARSDGYIAEINALEIGLAAISLGAGRMKKEDRIEPKAGITFRKKTGDKVKRGDIVAEIFTDDSSSIDVVKARIEAAIRLSRRKAEKKSKILEEL